MPLVQTLPSPMFRRRLRVNARTQALAPTGFHRTVPIPLPPGAAPTGATVRPLPSTGYPSDDRVGLTPSRALLTLAGRRAEVVRPLIDAFEATFEDLEEAVHARETAAFQEPDLVLAK